MPQPADYLVVWWILMIVVIVGCGIIVAELIAIIDSFRIKIKRAELRRKRGH